MGAPWRSGVIMLEKEELRELVQETVRETVNEVLVGLGFNPHDPQRMQANLHYLDKIRRGSEMMAQRVKITIITTLIPTFLYLFWQTIKNAFRN